MTETNPQTAKKLRHDIRTTKRVALTALEPTRPGVTIPIEALIQATSITAQLALEDHQNGLILGNGKSAALAKLEHTEHFIQEVQKQGAVFPIEGPLLAQADEAFAVLARAHLTIGDPEGAERVLRTFIAQQNSATPEADSHTRLALTEEIRRAYFANANDTPNATAENIGRAFDVIVQNTYTPQGEQVLLRKLIYDVVNFGSRPNFTLINALKRNLREYFDNSDSTELRQYRRLTRINMIKRLFSFS